MANRFKQLKRFKVLVGSLVNEIHEGIEIGYQRYPEQFMIEDFNHEQYMKQHETEREGIWLLEPQIKIENTDPRNVTITEEGVNYSNNYMDLCVPFDRYGTEISVGDCLYAAVKNEVRKVKVTKIAKKPFYGNYGMMRRKLTVVDDDNQTLTINDHYTTIKC